MPGTTNEGVTRGARVLSRRRLLLEGAGAAAGLAVLGPGLEGCGTASKSTSGGSSTGTAVMENYPNWMGSTVVQQFERQHPHARIKQVNTAPSSESAIVPLLKSGTYDFGLGDTTVGGQVKQIGILQPVDMARIPNIKYVGSYFRKNFPYGIPTDYGKVGIGYRPDLIKEKITSWHDLWRLAPKFSGKVVFIDLDRDSMGSALKYLGYSTNTHNPAQLEACKNAIIKIKPHLQAFLGTNVGRGLIDGSTLIAMDWDFDVALNKQKQPKIEWVNPSEGMTAYLEGWMAVKGTKHLPLVEEFMNFALEPKQYGSFVNTTGAAYVESAARPYIAKSLSASPIIAPIPAVLRLVEYETYLGNALPLWETTWQEIKAA
jgi:spermidine/putrescine transport system substrate-binding protein